MLYLTTLATAFFQMLLEWRLDLRNLVLVSYQLLKTNLPPNIFASHPPGNWLKAYPQKKEDWTNPAIDAFQPNWWDMGMIATLKFTYGKKKNRSWNSQQSKTKQEQLCLRFKP